MWIIVKYNVLYQHLISPSIPLPILKYYAFFIFIAKSNAFLFTSPAIAHSKRFFTLGKSTLLYNLTWDQKLNRRTNRKGVWSAFWYVRRLS